MSKKCIFCKKTLVNNVKIPVCLRGRDKGKIRGATAATTANGVGAKIFFGKRKK